MVESHVVRLSELVSGLETCSLSGEDDVYVESLSYDSRSVTAGSLFFCVPGLKRDGHEFAREAVARGAVALCVERLLDLPVAQVQVPDVRKAMAEISRRFYGDPSSKLKVVGITGTNGKTTTAYLTAWILKHGGTSTGLLSTVERVIGEQQFPATRTTPEALDLQRDLRAMVAAGNRAVVMEVSSHALELGRVDGLHFDAAAFTNFSQDHLDFHGSLEAYRAAKLRFFTDEVFIQEEPWVVVNIEDPVGMLIAQTVPGHRLLTYAVVSDPDLSGSFRPDLSFCDLKLGSSGLCGNLVLAGKAAELADVVKDEGAPWCVPLSAPLLGRYNAANVLTAVGLGLSLGVPLRIAVEAVGSFPGVPGRMQKVDVGQPFTVLVDYAHTPDSVENVLRAVKAVARGRIIAVLGCGGDRDRTKRPKMGRALEVGSDVPVITSDNPRSEEPQAIIEDMLAGLMRPDRAIVEVDRRVAIERALSMASKDDVVLILGKGHERGQEFKDRTIPFDDVEVAREVLLAMYGRPQ